MRYETNVFPIDNLQELSATYHLFEIVGLRGQDDDYDINVQYIIKSLSYKLKHPITVIFREEKPYLVVRSEASIMDRVPTEYHVKRDEIVYFKKSEENLRLDFKNYTPETKPIILRFLQFDIQTELNKDKRLWQPGSGDAFFSREYYDGSQHVAIYNGFLVRVMELPDGGFGFSVNVTKKYMARFPLKHDLTRDEFKKHRIANSHFVYHYGSKMYEIRADEFSDLNVSQYKFTRESDGRVVTLLEDIKDKAGSPMPPLVAKLPNNAAVLIYRTNDKKERGAPAGLCYQVFDTEDEAVKKLHKQSIIPPFPRRRYIRVVFHKYLSHIRYGNITLRINPKPIQIAKLKFTAPDIIFGNDTVLSTRRTPDTIHTNMGQLGRKRKDLLLDASVGFYTKAAFDTQYFIVPETVFNMYGNEKYFMKHLAHYVNRMHPTETGWQPIIITYDDRNKHTSVDIGFEITERMAEKIDKSSGGYAVVMLPSGVERRKRQHDELAALIVSECHDEYGITASIMHSDTLENSFVHQSVNGVSSYKIKDERRPKYDSYLKGVAINQVLLNNERWPYILHTPLHADLTIGIDVKRNIAGFTFINKYSRNILTRFDRSTNKEKLSHAQVLKMLVKYITLQTEYSTAPLKNIVVHRDGRLFNTERTGILKAIDALKDKGVLPMDASVTIVEIPKHAIVPFRLMEVTHEYDVLKDENDRGQVLNPEIGSWVRLSASEAFLCTTGREFAHDGTSIPLFVKINTPSLPIEQVMEDIFYLSCLAYTRPEDCSRFPLTIKITDRRINIMGGEFDLDSLEELKSVNS